MVILHDSEDRFHNLSTPGSYEWTYFDGLSDDGEWGFVAIWFRGCPMSPYYTAAIDRYFRNPSSVPPPRAEDFPAFNFNLYHRGRRVFYILQELPAASFGSDPGSADARLGGNAVRGETSRSGSKSFLFYLNAALSLGRVKLVGDIEMHAPPADLGAITSPYDPTAEGHFWVPAALDATFTARLDLWRFGRSTIKARFSGRAYHDRNFGTLPLHHLVADWHWGRLHSGRHLFVYFAVAPDDPGQTPFRRMLLLENGRLIAHADDLVLRESPRVSHWSTLRYPKELAGESAGSGLRFTARQDRAVDAGPFYHRLISRFGVELDGREIATGPGITEFLRPPRLGVAPFRPFVKFRVQRRKGGR